MTKKTSVALDDHFAQFVEGLVSEGRYGSSSEVVRAGLRLLEERETKLGLLREAVSDGLKSGPGAPLEVETFLARKSVIRSRETERTTDRG